MSWAVFIAVVAVAVFGGFLAYRSTRLDRLEAEWAIELRDGQPTSWAAPARMTVLSHVTADGEVIEYPTSFAFPWWAVAETLAEIDRFCEVAA